MQIIYLSPWWTFVAFFLAWPILQIAAAGLCRILPDKYFIPDNWFYRCHSWEKNGRFYRYFRIQQWKKLLPDGSAVVKSGYRKKHLTDISQSNLELFLIESCRAEMTHILGIVPFWLFGFIAAKEFMLYMLIYAILVNLPCIMAQRYNRPRIQKLLRQLDNTAYNPTEFNLKMND